MGRDSSTSGVVLADSPSLAFYAKHWLPLDELYDVYDGDEELQNLPPSLRMIAQDETSWALLQDVFSSAERDAGTVLDHLVRTAAATRAFAKLLTKSRRSNTVWTRRFSVTPKRASARDASELWFSAGLWNGDDTGLDLLLWAWGAGSRRAQEILAEHLVAMEGGMPAGGDSIPGMDFDVGVVVLAKLSLKDYLREAEPSPALECDRLVGDAIKVFHRQDGARLESCLAELRELARARARSRSR